MPAKSLKELVALAKAQPGQITLGSAGNGGTLHLPIEMLMKSANVKMTHVPYKGAAPAVDRRRRRAVERHVRRPAGDLAVRQGRQGAGRSRWRARSARAYFPDVPTTKEAGYSNVELQNYYALLLPAKTPRDIVAKLHDAVVKTVNTPAVREKLVELPAPIRSP